jgi:hypothetical protein
LRVDTVGAFDDEIMALDLFELLLLRLELVDNDCD